MTSRRRTMKWEEGRPSFPNHTNYLRIAKNSTSTLTSLPYGEPGMWRPNSPYGDRDWRDDLARHMASTTAHCQHHALSSYLRSFLLRASVTLSLVSSRLELLFEFYDKNRQDLFSRINSNWAYKTALIKLTL